MKLVKNYNPYKYGIFLVPKKPIEVYKKYNFCGIEAKVINILIYNGSESHIAMKGEPCVIFLDVSNDLIEDIVKRCKEGEYETDIEYKTKMFMEADEPTKTSKTNKKDTCNDDQYNKCVEKLQRVIKSYNDRLERYNNITSLTNTSFKNYYQTLVSMRQNMRTDVNGVTCPGPCQNKFEIEKSKAIAELENAITNVIQSLQGKIKPAYLR